MTHPPAAWTPILGEAGIAAELLGEGLTALRGMNHVQHDSSSHDLLATLIGLERLLRLNVLVDGRVESGEFPTLAVLQNDCGHKIPSLFESAELVRTRSPYEVEIRPELPDRAIMSVILGVLTEFATSTLYYILDVLVGSRKGGDLLAARSSGIRGLVM